MTHAVAHRSIARNLPILRVVPVAAAPRPRSRSIESTVGLDRSNRRYRLNVIDRSIERYRSIDRPTDRPTLSIESTDRSNRRYRSIESPVSIDRIDGLEGDDR